MVQRAMSDNGSAYRSKLFKDMLEGLSIRHIFTRPYTPRTNGKAERFVQTMLREWAYLVGYSRSCQRTALLPKLLTSTTTTALTAPSQGYLRSLDSEITCVASTPGDGCQAHKCAGDRQDLAAGCFHRDSRRR